MEPVSLAVGTAIGLLGLYSVCLEAMEQVEAGKDFENDFSQLLAMLQAERFHFKKWGEKVGVDGKSERHRCLYECTEEYLVVRSILKSLKIMWSDSETLSVKYGLEVHDPGVLARAKSLASFDEQKISFRRRFVWVSSDKKHFERLLENVGSFIQKLYSVISLGDEECKGFEIDSSLTELKRYLGDEARQRIEDRDEELAFRNLVENYLEDNHRNGLLDWVGRVSTEAKFDDWIRGRHPGSCTWFRLNDRFLDWFGPPYDTPATLWLHDPPGIGKTYLSASIVESLRSQSSRPTAYFFCANENVESNQVMSILRAWIVQLAVRREKVLQVIQKHKPEDSKQAVPSVLWKLFHDVLKSVGGCHLVIDGFDECLDAGPWLSRGCQEPISCGRIEFDKVDWHKVSSSQ